MNIRKSQRSLKSNSFDSEAAGVAEGVELEPDRAHLWTFMFTMILSGATQGYTDYSNQAAALYNAQYQWSDSSEIVHHQQWIGASIILGCMIGALGGAKLMQYGRRRAHFYACAIGILGVSLTLITNY